MRFVSSFRRAHATSLTLSLSPTWRRAQLTNVGFKCNTIASFPGRPVERMAHQMRFEAAFSVPAG